MPERYINEPNQKTQGAITAFIVFLILVIGVIFLIFKVSEKNTQEREVAQRLLKEQQDTARKDILEILSTRVEGKPFTTDKIDPWGTPYRIETLETTEHVIIDYRVRSAGPDKEFGNQDDLYKTESDFNWTNAGTSIGKRGGRFVKGLIKGAKESNDGK